MGDVLVGFSLRSFLAGSHTVLQVWRKDKGAI